MTATTHTLAGSPTATGPFDWLHRARADHKRRTQVRRARVALGSLSDNILRDIGVSELGADGPLARWHSFL